jgi:tape measure domain-containing protein
VIIRELVTLLGFDLNDGPLKKYDKQIDSTKAKSNMLAKAARGVGTAYKVAAAAVAVGIGWISKNIIDATIEMEGYRSEIQAFTGDAESAAEALAELRDKTIDPLFGTGNLVKAYKQLRTIGMSAEDTSRMIDVLGDVANGSAENFNSLSNILTRTAATGKFGSMQLNQLAQAGFGAQDMAQGLGISVEQLNKDLEAGKIGYKELTRAIEGATREGGRFYQNAARQALTLSGSIKILQDVISSMGDAIGTKVLPGLVSLIRYVTNLIKLGENGLVNFGANAFDRLIHIIYQVLIFFEVMQMRIKRLGLSFEPLKGIFQDVFGLLGTVVNAIVPVLYNLAAVIVAAFKPIRALLKPIIEALKPIIQDIFGFAAEMIGALVPVVQGLTPYFEDLGERIGQLLDKVRPVLKNIMAAIKAAFEPIKAFVIPIIEALKPVFMGVFSAISGILDEAGKKTSGLAGFIVKLTPVFSALGQFIGAVIEKLWALRDVIGPIIAGLITFAGVLNIANKVQAAVKAFMAMKAAIIGIGTAMKVAFLANPVGAIIAAVAALIVIIVLLVKNWDKVKAAFGKTGEAIKSGIGKLGGFFSGLGKKISTGFANAFEKTKEKTKELLADFKEKYPALYETAAAVFGKIKEVVAAVFGWIKKYFSVVLQALKKSLGVLIGVFKTIFFSIWNVVKTMATGIWNVIKTVFDSIKNVVISILSVFKIIFFSIFNVIKTIFTTILGTVISIFDGLISIWKGGGNVFVKLWKSIKLVFSKVWQGIFVIVKSVWTAIVNVWKSIVNVFSTILNGIKNVFSAIWNAIKNNVFAVVDGIKNVWISFAVFLGTLWDGIKAIASVVWEGIKAVFFTVVDAIKFAWQTAINFIVGLWEGIKQAASVVWGGIKNTITGVIDGIKAVWIGLISFFSGLWEAIKQGPTAVVEYISNIFSNLWNSITDKFFAFINVIKDGWEKVKGFFGGLWEGAVNFFTGGGPDKEAPETKPVNDLIVTPEGKYSTHPDDYIMAMREPSSLIEALARLLGQGQLQPAYAGASPDNSLVGSVIREKAQQNTYNSNSTSNSTNIDSKATITVNVPAGTTAEQAASIARQVDQAVKNSLASAIGGARGMTPSPEARRL